MNKTTYESVKIEPNHFANILHFTPLMLSEEQLNHREYYKHGTDYFIPPHWHRALEFTYVKKGKLTLRINGETKIIKTGEFLLVNSGELHELQSLENEDFDIQCLIISYPLLKYLIPDFYSYRFELRKDTKSMDHFKDKFEQIMSLNKDDFEYNYLKINSIILDLVFDLLKEHVMKKEKGMMESQEFIIGAIDYIHVNYEKPLTLEQISKDFGMSREHFARLFKASIGSTFLQYLTDYRIYRAFPEIVHSDLTIESIGRKHGFPNTKALISQFDARYGKTPAKYRKDHKISIIDHNDDFLKQQ